MHRNLRTKVCAALAGLAVPLAPLVAHADDISNNLDGSVDAVAEVMSLSQDGADGTTQLYVIARNGDGKNGCNLTGSTTLVAAVSSSDTAVATVSPSSVTFDSCSASPALTVTPHGVGTATISLKQTSNSSGGTFNLAPATFTVDVSAPPNTPPAVEIGGVIEGGEYAKGAAPPATCQVSDAENGNSSFAATLSAVSGPYATDGIGEQTASCSYTDGGGLTAAGSKTYRIVDPTPPSIGHVLNPATPNGAGGWYTGDVALTWAVTEEESPNSLAKEGCLDRFVTGDQLATAYSCSASSAGGQAAQQTVTIKRDATAPSNVAFVGGPINGARYFPNTVPAAPVCIAEDATSGLADCSVSGHSTAVGTHTLLATARDNAGNETTVTGATYTVRKLTLDGFFAPVDMGGTVNTVKNGATVPLKFTVSDEGVPQTTTDVVKNFVAAQTNCLSGAVEDVIEATATGGTNLRYDTSAGQYVQNWKTPAKAGACYTVTMTTIDDSTIPAKFKLK